MIITGYRKWLGWQLTFIKKYFTAWNSVPSCLFKLSLEHNIWQYGVHLYVEQPSTGS